MNEVPECFYRVSVKALVLNETRDKFLIVKESDGEWELPGGGLDWGSTPQEDLPREIEEEMGLKVTSVADHPSYFITDQTRTHKMWFVNVLYETTLEHLNFTPSEECVEIAFVDAQTVQNYKALSNVVLLAEMFDPQKHN